MQKKIIRESLAVLLLSSVTAYSATSQTEWLDPESFREVPDTKVEEEQEEVVVSPLPSASLIPNEQASVVFSQKQAAISGKGMPTEADNDMLTITSEGSFLLPTYVLPEVKPDVEEVQGGSVQTDSVFRKETDISVQKASLEVPQSADNDDLTAPDWADKIETSSEKTETETQKSDETEEKTMAELTADEASDEQKAQGTTNESLMLSKIKQEYGDETTSKMSDSEKALVKYATALAETAAQIEQLESDLKAVNLDKPLEEEAPALTLASAEELSKEVEEALAEAEKEEKPLLLPLVVPQEKKTEVAEADVTPVDEFDFEPKKPEINMQLLPSEIKITFKPENADISGQTLKWIRAFASQMIGNPKKYVEVRLSRATPKEIGLRRAILLKGTLLGSGVGNENIQFVYSNRHPDSVVLRILEKPEEFESEDTEGNFWGKKKQARVKKW